MLNFTLDDSDAGYRERRDKLLAAEIALRDQREAVAALRRELPMGPGVEDYVFREGPADLARNAAGDFSETRLSMLFAPGQTSLILIHFMYAPEDEAACPMCSMWADGYDAVTRHVTDKASLALVAKTGVATLRQSARTRGWTGIRLLSSEGTAFNRDFGMESEDGTQLPGVSVFCRGDDGEVRHFYTGCALLGPEQYRGLDLFSPVWHLFDLLPEGRGEWWPRRDYG